MDLYGYYALQDNTVDIIEFLACNFEMFGAVLVPSKKPTIIIASTDGFSEDPALNYPLFYSHRLLVTPADDGHPYSLENTLVIDREKLASLLARIAPGHKLLALWQMLLHELRHFVQNHLLAETDLLSVLTLYPIREVNESAADTLQRNIRRYNPIEMQSYEADAVICAGLTLGMMCNSCTQKQIDEAIIKETLLLTQNSFERNPARWIRFNRSQPR